MTAFPPLSRDAFETLFDAARTVRERAYAPYSGFRVGAALLADDGGIYAGCNVENAAYPQSTCAEAAAITAMVAGGGARILAAMVVAERIDARLTTPCGGCRQRLAEFAGPDTPVHCAEPSATARARHTMAGLLPESFSMEGR